MSKLKFELDRNGVRELLNSSEMRDVLNEYASEKLNALGPGYDALEGSSGQRAKVTIAAITPETRKDNLENNTLIKVVLG